MAAQSPETLPPSNLPAPHKLIWRLFTGTSPPSSLPPWYKQYLLTTLTSDDTVSFFVVLYVFTLPPIKAQKCFARTFLTFLLSTFTQIENNINFLVNFIKMLTYINLQIYYIEYFQCRYLFISTAIIPKPLKWHGNHYIFVDTRYAMLLVVLCNTVCNI